MSTSPSEVTRLIQRWQSGDADALSDLLPLVYADLRAMAARTLQGEQRQATLQPTALVHDVFVRMLGAERFEINDGEHLFRTAARMMRRILIDRIRGKDRDKRGGGWIRADMLEAMGLPIPEQTDIGLLDAALSSLEEVDERLAHIVELRYFVGLSVEAVAAVLDVDKRTVYRDWALAKVWLRREMER